ncbi:MAG: hypothetical protein GY799_30885 [Desulfobulbaceae bacterium]|nr:hypothetical protein [Desulfobulbaceae bacterium]
MISFKKFALYCLICSPTFIALGVIAEKIDYSLFDVIAHEEEITEGTKDGFVVGSSKEETFQNLLEVKEKNGGLTLNLYYDNDPTNCIQLPTQNFIFAEVVEFDYWGLIYEDPGKEVMRIEFSDDRLSKIIMK